MENLKKKKKKSQQYQIDEIAASLQPVAISPTASALIVSLHTPKPRVGSAVIIRGVIEV